MENILFSSRNLKIQKSSAVFWYTKTILHLFIHPSDEQLSVICIALTFAEHMAFPMKGIYAQWSHQTRKQTA